MGLEIQVKKGAYGKSIDPMRNFMKKLKNPESQRQYPARLKYFMDAIFTKEDEEDPEKDTFRPLTEIKLEDQIAEFMKYSNDPEWVKDAFFKMVEVNNRRVKAKKITDTTIFNYYKAAKKFCDANGITTNWAEILEEVPTGRKSSNDRKPTLDEIRKLVSYHDKRIKAIVYTMVSSGIRISSWNYLKWGDIDPYFDKDGKVTCAKLRAYNIKRKNVNDGDKYYTTFISSEAYYELEKWINFRIAHGEDVNKQSWVMRDLFESTKKNGNNVGNINNPKPLKSTGIKTMLERAARSAKLFEPLKDGQKRREWKLSHGLRKWYKSRAESENSIKSVFIEMLLDHDVKLDQSYNKPTEIELRDMYLKIVPLVTIEEANLQKDKMKEEIKAEVKQEYQSIYEKQFIQMKKEILLMKFDKVLQRVIADKRHDDSYYSQGIYLTPQQQYEEFIQLKPNHVNNEDLELIKQMVDNGEIEEYVEESPESEELTEKIHDRWNEYNRLGKIDFNESIVANQWFDDNDNLIIEFDKKEVNRENLVLPPVKK